ncbi:hypothetical protein [Pantoea vagans]|nr:hypothetical protein [Pantoea vagans]
MSKCNALLYAMVVGFGFVAGIHTYLAWSSLLEIVWQAVKAAVTNA